MRRLSLLAWGMLLCAGMQQSQAQQTTPQAAVPNPNQPVQTAPMPEQMPNDLLPNDLLNGATPRVGLPVARPSQIQDNLESPGLIQTTLNQAPAVAAPNVNSTTVVETTTVAAPAPTVVPVGKKWLMVPPMILDMMMSDTLILGGGLGSVVIGGGPIFGVGSGLPHLPVDEVCVLPRLCVSANTCLTVPLPEACTLVSGQQLRAVMMIGGHVQLVPLELTAPCTATITLPNMLLSGEFPATLLLGLNTGDMLYEQPLTLTPVITQ